MEKIDEPIKQIYGAEGIVIHNGNIVLGMQKPKRWYKLENGEKASVIKTLGGEIEDEDENSSKNALIREVLEEVKDITENDIRISKIPIFSKTIDMREINPYERQSKIKMRADFYILEIKKKGNITPNDLPALVEMKLNRFLEQEFCKSTNINKIQDCIIRNQDLDGEIPQNYALMIPQEVKRFFEKILSVPER